MQQLSKQANNKTEKQNKQPSKKVSNKLSKLPNTARSAALAVLGEVLAEGAYTNIAINKYLRTHQLESMERRSMPGSGAKRPATSMELSSCT